MSQLLDSVAVSRPTLLSVWTLLLLGDHHCHPYLPLTYEDRIAGGISTVCPFLFI